MRARGATFLRNFEGSDVYKVSYKKNECRQIRRRFFLLCLSPFKKRLIFNVRVSTTKVLTCCELSTKCNDAPKVMRQNLRGTVYYLTEENYVRCICMRLRNIITLYFLNSDNQLLLFFFSYKFTIALYSLTRWFLPSPRGPYLLREKGLDLFWAPSTIHRFLSEPFSLKSLASFVSLSGWYFWNWELKPFLYNTSDFLKFLYRIVAIKRFFSKNGCSGGKFFSRL